MSFRDVTLYGYTLRFKSMQCTMDYLVCRLSGHDRKLLVTNNEGGK